MPPNAQDGDLLKRAVVSLERKLRESQKAAAALQREVDVLRQETQELPAVRGRLAEALARRGDLQGQADRWQRQAVQSQAEAEEALRQRDRAQAAQAGAEAAQEQAAAKAAEWRADSEALQLGEARARGQAQVLEEQMQQLEAANSGLRQDNQQHAAKLREAYERWVAGGRGGAGAWAVSCICRLTQKV
jgi:chromosome segregation ATPase